MSMLAAPRQPTLAELLGARDESLRVARVRPLWHRRALVWVRGLRWAWLLTALLSVAGFVSKHGLVLGAGAAFVVGAALITPIAGWFVAGIVLMLLELRRR